MEKKYERIVDFVAEQNRLMRTGGLPKNHPAGGLEPSDYPLSASEKRYWNEEEKLYQEMINELHGINLED